METPAIVDRRAPYLVEVEIEQIDTNRLALLHTEKQIDKPLSEGHYLIVKNDWFRVNRIIHDTDNKKTIIHLDRLQVTTDEFEHSIREFKLKGWLQRR